VFIYTRLRAYLRCRRGAPSWRAFNAAASQCRRTADGDCRPLPYSRRAQRTIEPIETLVRIHTAALDATLSSVSLILRAGSRDM